MWIRIPPEYLVFLCKLVYTLSVARRFKMQVLRLQRVMHESTSTPLKTELFKTQVPKFSSPEVLDPPSSQAPKFSNPQILKP